MADQTGSNHVSNDYLETLERVKKQYQQYVEVSRLYELPARKEEEKPAKRRTPSRENPLTTDQFRVKQKGE